MHDSLSRPAQGLSAEHIHQRVQELGSWFHNLDLCGIQTAPDHFLGDYPALKWRRFAHALPPDLQGKSVLDIGCNGGFYAIEMKRRGADRVVGYPFEAAQLFNRPDFPRLYFIEKRYAGDPTNWWIPNRACVEALLRHAGFDILSHPEAEVFVCRRKERPHGSDAVYPAPADHRAGETHTSRKPGRP